MLCTENMDRFCGCLTKPQTVPQNPDKPFLAPSLAQNSNSMKKTVIPGIANWSMSSLIAFRIIPCLLGKPFFSIAKSPFSLMFQDAEDEVGGALARANLIAMIHTDHDDRQPVACIGSRPNGLRYLPVGGTGYRPLIRLYLKLEPKPINRPDSHRSGARFVRQLSHIQHKHVCKFHPSTLQLC